MIYFRVDYKAADNSDLNLADCKVVLSDKNGTEIGTVNNCTGKIEVLSANLWWPFLMHPDPGYLYELKVIVF